MKKSYTLLDPEENHTVTLTSVNELYTKIEHMYPTWKSGYTALISIVEKFKDLKRQRYRLVK